jgi:Ras family protein T1
MKSAVRILVVGDEKVGKSALISTLVSQHFSEQVPALMHDVTLPREESDYNVLTTIMDSSAHHEDVPHLQQQMGHCDVIILVYAADRPDTFSRITSYWLPLIEKSCTVPVVLVGNKIDTRRPQQMSSTDLQRRVTPILQKFKFVEAYDECSTKKLPQKVGSIFYLAQKAVIFPLSPLFDMDSSSLTSEFETALERVFRVYDQDRDGVLSDTELNDFQRECFDVTLEQHHIADLKKKLQREMPEGAVCTEGILRKGFFFLNKLFLERNRPESTWEVLRKFNYDDNLQLLFPGELAPRPLQHDRNNDDSAHYGQLEDR